MIDPRYRKLARLLVEHSCSLKPGEKILIEATAAPEPMLSVLLEEVVRVGAHPMLSLKSEFLERKLIELGSYVQAQKRFRIEAELQLFRLQQADAFLEISGSNNSSELSGISPKRLALSQEIPLDLPCQEEKLLKLRWCLLNWPTPSMAQQAGLSTEELEDFFFAACLVDYQVMSKAVQPLKILMDQTKQVRITGPDTDLEFSIEGIKALACTGENNIPDGECYTAPIKDSAQGRIRFNASTTYWGSSFEDISLTFRDGRVVEHKSTNDQALAAILDCDQGARYLGEFALAFHPLIDRPIKDILFDEKIRGSLHLALGQTSPRSCNGNHSKIHWDLVLMQESGGEVHFDNRVIRRDGRFIIPELEALNPERLSP